MIELLYAVLSVFGISTIFYFIFATFQYLKIYFYSFHFLLWILLISLNQYKNHYLWDEPDFNPIQELPYSPINTININLYSNNTLKDINVKYSNKRYSLIETKEFSQKCLDSYFIPQSEICPITDIIIEYNGENTYLDYEKIPINNGFIYYNRHYEFGKYYDSVQIQLAYNNKNFMFGNEYKTIKFTYSYDCQNIKTIKRLEENKRLKPFRSFKNYINFVDIICLFLLIFSFIYYLIDNKDDNIHWNYFRIIDNSLQVILFIFYLVRFILFGKLKTFFKINKDLYNNEYLSFNRKIYYNNYFPNNYSINSFPLALSLVFLFYLLLSLFFQKKCSLQKREINNNNTFGFFNDEQKMRIFMLSLPFLIIYLICLILDIINDVKITKIYKNIIDNWATSPISSIKLSDNKDSSYELGHIFSKKKNFILILGNIIILKLKEIQVLIT